MGASDQYLGWLENLNSIIEASPSLGGLSHIRPSVLCRSSAPLKHADEHQECLLIGADQKGRPTAKVTRLSSSARWLVYSLAHGQRRIRHNASHLIIQFEALMTCDNEAVL